MEIDELFGLPAHALLVHVPIVLVPTAFGLALVALLPRARWAAAPLAAVVAVGGAVGAVLAMGAGMALEDRVAESDLVDDHTDKGEAAELPAIAFAVVAVGGAVAVEVGRRQRRAARREARGEADEPAVSPGPGAAAAPSRRRTPPAWAATAVLVASAGVGAYATYTVAEAGHSGSKAVWDGQLVDEDGGDGGDEDGGDGGGQGRGRGRGGDDPDQDEGGSG